MRKKGFFKKALIYSLVSAIIAGNTMPALAYTNSEGKVNETQDITESQDAQCEVYAQLGTEFKVIIPKKITLSGSTKKGSYTVDVEGDIGGTDTVKVVPEESFTLTSTGLASQTAKVSQDKTAWSWNEILPDSKTIGNGSISASGISAGSWNGSFWFNISLEEGAGSGNVEESDVDIMVNGEATNDVAIGTGDSIQLDVYVDGEKANDRATWESDNKNITVNNGLVETTSSAQTGESANITVSVDEKSISVNVTLIDILLKVDGTEVTSIDVKQGESVVVDATIIPSTIKNNVTWTTTAQSGINLIKSGNSVTVKVAGDMTTGSKLLIASYGSYSKLLIVNVVENSESESHVHSYTGSVTKEATCTEDGVKTFTCECGDSYTEVITTTGHNFNNGSCTECGEADPDYVLEAGLYDADGNLLCTWEESGIDAEKNYNTIYKDENNYKLCTTSPYYVLNKVYPKTKKVVIPEGVTKIGNFAFTYCEKITSVTIPEGVISIGDGAFQYSQYISDISIPSSVTSIGNEAFDYCLEIDDITFKTTTGWYVGRSTGSKEISINSEKLSDTSTAAKYLKSTFTHNYYWTRYVCVKMM